MNHAAENELFSAYLDGELTVEEQARVEQVLAASPDARQLLEDLRSLSQTLQSLPTERVPEDVSPIVLREAERRMLAEAPQPLTVSTQGPMVGLDWTGLLRRLFRPRVMIWSALAVALALMVTLFDPARRELAQSPTEPASHTVPQASLPAPTLQTASSTESKPEMAPAGSAWKAPRSNLDAVQTAKSPTGQQSAPGKDTSLPPSSPGEHPKSTRPEGTLAGSHPAETSPSPAGNPTSAKTAVSDNQKRAAPGEPSVIVRCDIRVDALEQGLWDKLLAEHRVAKQSDVPSDTTATSPQNIDKADSAKTIRVRTEISDVQLDALLAKMKVHSEAFSSIAVESKQPRTDAVAPVPQSAAIANAGTRQGVAAAVRIELAPANGKAKPGPKSRVTFDPNAPPPPPVTAQTSSPAKPSPATTAPRSVVFILHVLDAAGSASSAKSP